MPINKSLVLFVTALNLSTALAATRIPGTYTYYAAQRDPITDANTGYVSIDEINDTAGQTYFVLRCSNQDYPEIWANLTSKNDLLDPTDAAVGIKPDLTIRLGTDAPILLRNADMTNVVDSNDQMLSHKIGFQGSVVQTIVRGLRAGKRLAVRVNRLTGGQALTYIFPAEGFASAWAGVNQCSSGPGTTGRQAGSSAPVGLSRSSNGLAAPKFTQWYFTTCRDAETGVSRTGLLAGRAHLCDLVVETVPNGLRPISAEFRYELEYREAGQPSKLTLPDVDRWSAGSGAAKFRQSGKQLIFTLPLNVRARPNRVYTSINVTASIMFDNGASKQVYEALPIRSFN